MKNSKLFCSPFLGEMGWLLFCWQGYLRTISKNFDEVVIAGKPGTEFLYKDFMTKFIPYEVEGINTSSSKLHDYTVDLAQFDYLNYTSLITPEDIHKTVDKKPGSLDIKPTYISYGNRTLDKDIDVLIHCRYSKKNFKTEWYRNWSKEYTDILVSKLSELGYKVAFIGSENGSYATENYEKHFDISLEELTKIMNRSKLICGPSSGPMHYGQLNEVPTVVTFGPKDGFLSNHDRYTLQPPFGWNPFRVDTICLEGVTWMPDLELLIESIQDMLTELYGIR